ncbi:MAG: hypothetical protein HY960_04510 [Ignavibacteriae bacterium]|nr:hypothetical protein [Ignavibacteriota bacterium]
MVNKAYLNIIICISCVVVVISSCTTINATSNYDRNQSRKIGKILILFSTNEAFNDLMEGFYSTFKMSLDSSGIESKNWRDDGLSLENDLKKVINDFEPDVILKIVQTEAKSYHDGWLTLGASVKLNASLIDVKLLTPFWRSNIDVNCTKYSYPGRGDGRSLAREVGNLLEKDKIILNFRHIQSK